MKRFLCVACLAVGSLSVANSQQAGSSTAGPALFVLLVVDQMRADYLERYADRFTDGFKRLVDRGAVFTEARYPYASTKTAEAHALMLSGWSPSGSGIVGDQWYDRRTKSIVTAAASANHRLLDSPGEGGSPEQLLVHTVGDALKEAHPHSVVMTASWKRYTAVLNGGHHADAAYWFDTVTGHFVTSDYYATAYPAWVTRFNHGDLTAPFFGKTWLTHTLGTGAAPDENYRTAFRATPFANDTLLGFAKDLVQHAGVGTDADPDIVAVSFSGLDYVGHQYGPETAEFDATIEALDHQIGDFLRALDAQVGADRYALALTADHGAALLPEKERARGHDAGRLSVTQLRTAVEQAVAAALQTPGPFIAAADPPELWVNYHSGSGRSLSRSEIDRALVTALQAQPGIARAYTADDISMAASSNDAYLKAVAAGYYPDRSGDIYMLVKPNYIFYGDSGTTHGTPYDYDAHVPLILFGRGIKTGRYLERVRTNELAPTIGALLGVPFKGDPEGRVLAEALTR